MNKVLTAIDKSGSFRVYLVISTELVQKAAEIHKTTPLATAALGRVLTGAGLMGLMLKNRQDKLTVIFNGDGPARQILATADGSGHVKGYIANPSDLSPEELDGIEELQTEEPERFAEEVTAMHQKYGLKLLGGCCGTDERHMEAIIRRLLELHPQAAR